MIRTTNVINSDSGRFGPYSGFFQHVKAQNTNIRAFWNASFASVMCNRMSIKFSIYLLFGLLQNNTRVGQGSNSNNELKKNV